MKIKIQLDKARSFLHRVAADAKFSAAALINSLLGLPMFFVNTYEVECWRDGVMIWSESNRNIVVNEGLDDVLDKYFKGSTYTASHAVGLTTGTPTFAAGDTLASHAGWTEFTNYDEANRPDLTGSLSAVSGQSTDNTANRAIYTISAGGGTIGGAFVSVDNTKGGTTGVLYGGAAFTTDRVLAEADELRVAVTLTAATA